MFTDREREVLRAMRRAQSRSALAAELDVSVHTVDFHLRNIASKIPGRGPRMRRIMRWLISHPEGAETAAR